LLVDHSLVSPCDATGYFKQQRGKEKLKHFGRFYQIFTSATLKSGKKYFHLSRTAIVHKQSGTFG
jgi:hypothetical protein